MKNTLKLLCAALVLFSFPSCEEDETVVVADDDMMQQVDPYKACCDMAPVAESWDTATYYIPNAFTPNGDGINDVFIIFASAGIEKIDSLVIADKEGAVLAVNTDFGPNDVSTSWNSLTPAGVSHRGAFDYRVVLRNVLGETRRVEGSACSILCIAGEKLDSIPHENCFFSVQHDGDGGLDTHLPSFEGACFE